VPIVHRDIKLENVLMENILIAGKERGARLAHCVRGVTLIMCDQGMECEHFGE
jgi:hypothetical protein